MSLLNVLWICDSLWWEPSTWLEQTSQCILATYITFLSIFSLHFHSYYGKLHANTHRYQKADPSTPQTSAEWFLDAWQFCSGWERFKYNSYLRSHLGKRHSLGMPLMKLIVCAVIPALETWVGNPVRYLGLYSVTSNLVSVLTWTSEIARHSRQGRAWF